MKQKEYEDLPYAKTVFDHSYYTADIIFDKHKTIIFIDDSFKKSQYRFRTTMKEYPHTAVYCLRDRKIRTKKYTLIFKSRSQVVNGDLRGYDKYSTILINRGGLC